MNKLDKESVIGISALLIHAANIDEIYSDHEKDLVKDFIKSYLKDDDVNEILNKAEKIENNSNQLLAMKGESIDREIKLLQSHNFQTQIIDLSHPDLASQPKLVRIKSLN